MRAMMTTKSSLKKIEKSSERRTMRAMMTTKRSLKKIEKASRANIRFSITDGTMSVTAHEHATIEPAVTARTKSVAHLAAHSEPRKPLTGARSSSDAAIVRTISGIMKTASDQFI